MSFPDAKEHIIHATPRAVSDELGMKMGLNKPNKGGNTLAGQNWDAIAAMTAFVLPPTVQTVLGTLHSLGLNLL